MPNLDSNYDEVVLSLNRYIFGAGLTINSEEECKIIKKFSELSINYTTSIQQTIVLLSSIFLSMIILLWTVLKDSINLIFTTFGIFYKNSYLDTPENSTKALQNMNNSNFIGVSLQMILTLLFLILTLLFVCIMIINLMINKYKKVLIISEMSLTSTHYEYPIIIKPGIIYQKIQPYFKSKKV